MISYRVDLVCYALYEVQINPEQCVSQVGLQSQESASRFAFGLGAQGIEAAAMPLLHGMLLPGVKNKDYIRPTRLHKPSAQYTF